MKEAAVVIILVLIAIIAIWGGPREQAVAQQPVTQPVMAAPVAGPLIVVDGDTVKNAQGESFRLRGLDAPETGYHAKCQSEHDRGKAAAARLQQLLAPPAVVTMQVAPSKDKYGRGLADIYANGINVAHVLIAEGLARQYDGRGRRQPWC